MRYLVSLFALSPAVALADTGPHLHPHGVELIWPVLAAFLAGAVVARVWMQWRK